VPAILPAFADGGQRASGGYWDFASAKLTLCYEMAAEFAQLSRRYGTAIRLPHYRSDTTPILSIDAQRRNG